MTKRDIRLYLHNQENTVQLGNTDVGLYDTSSIALYIPHKGRPYYDTHKSTCLGYKDIARHPFHQNFPRIRQF